MIRGDVTSIDRALAGDLLPVDLAALQLVAAASNGQPERYVHAHAAAHTALAQDPSNQRALFNLALAQEQLFLDEEAIATWETYLRVEPEPSWREEARAHMVLLRRKQKKGERRRLVNSIPASALLARSKDDGQSSTFEARQSFLYDLLRSFGGTDPKSSCNDLLQWLAIARVQQETNGDRWLQDSSRWLEDNFCAGDKAEASLSRTLNSLQQAIELYDESDSAKSLQMLRRDVAPVLRRTRSPLLSLVDVYSAVNTFALNRYSESLRHFEALEPVLRERGYLYWAARSAWLRGTIALRSNDHDAALAHYFRALGDFDRLRDEPHRAAIRALLAETYGRMGVSSEAWRHAQDALRIARSHGLPQRMFMVCAVVATTARSLGLDSLSAEYQTCAIRYVPSLDNHAYSADAYLWRAIGRSRGGGQAAAAVDLELAKRHAEQIPDADERRQARSDNSLLEGFLILREDPIESMRLLETAIAFYESVGHSYHAADAHQLRASAALEAGRREAAKRSLIAAMEHRERHRTQDRNAASRLAVLQNDHSIYDRLVQFELDDSNHWASLVFADRSKQDVYVTGELSKARLPASQSTKLQAWKGQVKELGGGIGLVSLQVLSDELIAWFIEPGEELELVKIPTSRKGTEPLSKEGNWARSLGHEIVSRLPGASVVVVVPDKELNGFPFALLPISDKDVLFDHATVIIATSLDDFLQPARTKLTGLTRRADVFLAPAVSERAERGLAKLTPNSTEVEPLHNYFREVKTYQGVLATASQFLESAEVASLLHYGGHADVNPRRPLESALLLAEDTSPSDGRVTAAELYESSPHAPLLVALAACNSSAAPSSLPLSLALVRPFLNGGASAVVGSLTPLRDDDAEVFFGAFYAELGQAEDVVRAFRVAAERLRQTSVGREDWARLQLYGSRALLSSEYVFNTD